MKQKILFSAFIVVIFSTITWFGCHTDFPTKSEIAPDVIERIEKLGLDTYNKKLLADFFSGELSDGKGRKILPFSVSLWHDMLYRAVFGRDGLAKKCGPK